MIKMKEKEIRADFAKALERVEEGRRLSSKIGYGFFDKDITNLAILYKANRYREKIEDLLTDCNFHSECEDFINGNFSKYIKEDTGESA